MIVICYVGTYSIGVCFCPKKCRPDSDHIKMPLNYTHVVTKKFDLFTKGCDFTDDSVMTIAVGEALLAVGLEATVKEIEEAVVTNMQDWGKRYPYAGYGGRFRYWFRERNPKPYGSYGNGSAMRVSVAGCGARIVFGEKGE